MGCHGPLNWPRPVLVQHGDSTYIVAVWLSLGQSMHAIAHFGPILPSNQQMYPSYEVRIHHQNHEYNQAPNN